MRVIAGVLAFILPLLAWSVSQAGQHNWVILGSTPDISVGATSTNETFFGVSRENPVSVQRIMIKNDCAEDLYFGVRGVLTTGDNDTPIRLSQDSSVTITARSIPSVLASPAIGNTVTCTFTLVPFRQ